MADTRISGLVALTGAAAADGDLLVVVDISDSTMAGTGSDKSITLSQFATAMRTRVTAGGDASGPLSALVLANSGVAAGTYGTATQVPRTTYDAKGRATAVSLVTISTAGSSPFAIVAPGIGGIVGDGVTNDTTAIQTILSANAGATIFALEGTYAAAGLSLPNDTALLNDPLATWLLNSNSVNLFDSIGSRCQLRGGTYNGNGFGTGYNCYPIRVTGDDSTIQGVRVINSPAMSIQLEGADRTLIDGCHIQSLRSYNSAFCTLSNSWILGEAVHVILDSSGTASDGWTFSNVTQVYTGAGPIDYVFTIQSQIQPGTLMTNVKIDNLTIIISGSGTGTNRPVGGLSAVGVADLEADGIHIKVSQSIRNEAVEFAGNIGMHVDNLTVEANGLADVCGIVHDCLDWELEKITLNDPTTAAAGKKALVIYSDVAAGCRRGKVSMAKAVLQSNSQAPAYWIEQAGAGVIDDIELLDCDVMGNPTNGTGTVPVSLHGTMSNIRVKGGYWRDFDFPMEYGNVTGLRVEGVQTGGTVARPNVWYNPTGSPSGLVMIDNSWQFGAGAPGATFGWRGAEYVNLSATTTTTRKYIETDAASGGGGTTWANYTTSA